MKLQSSEYAKANILKNFRANYTNDHQFVEDTEIFLNNALDQLEKIVRSDCAYDRDKQDEAVKNLFRDYLKNTIEQRRQELENKIGDSEMLDSEAGFMAGLNWVKANI
jgi:hypothetical protein